MDNTLNSKAVKVKQNSKAVNSKAVNSIAVNSKAVNSKATNSKAVNSKATNSKAVNSKAVNSKATNSKATNSKAVNSKNSSNVQVTKEPIIKSYVRKLQALMYKYRYYIIIVVIILFILYFCYTYSEKRRIKSRLNYLTNNLNYNKEKVNIEFCGLDNDIKNTYKSKIIINTNDSENSDSSHSMQHFHN